MEDKSIIIEQRFRIKVSENCIDAYMNLRWVINL